MRFLSSYYRRFGLPVLLITQALSVGNSQADSQTSCALAQPTGAILYEMGGKRATELFSYRLVSSPSQIPQELGSTKGEYVDRSGAVIASEELIMKAGQPAHYRFENFVEHEVGTADIEGAKLVFTYQSTVDGSEKEIEDLPDNYVIGPYVATYLEKHLDELRAGKSVKVHVGVLTRLETISFVFKQDAGTQANSSEVLRVIGKPANFIVAALVAPHHLTYDLINRRLISLEGKTQLEVPTPPGSDHFKTVSAEVVFTYLKSACENVS